MSMRAICPIIFSFATIKLSKSDNVFCMYSRKNLAAKCCRENRTNNIFRVDRPERERVLGSADNA